MKCEKEVLVWLKHVLTPNIALDPFSASNPLPRLGNRTREQVCGRDPKKMTVDCHHFLMDEAHRREELDHEEEQINTHSELEEEGGMESDNGWDDEGDDSDER